MQPSTSRSPAGRQANPPQDYLTTAATIGAVAAGAALLEAALIPGIVIGGAAMLAPRYLRKLQRSLPPLFRRAAAAAPAQHRMERTTVPAVPARFGIEQAVVKTITFRIIVTTLDFTTNYVVLGEFATAAGLSTISLVAGPVFYFVHETAWNYFGPSVMRSVGRWGEVVDLPARLSFRPQSPATPAGRTGFTISRALAKTITFRTFATAMDFTTTYIVVGDLVTAAALSSVGFVVGPFVYLGHEMAWDYYGASRRNRVEALS